MKGLALLALALPGGVVVVGGIAVAACYHDLKTGTEFDALRLPVIYGVARAFPTSPTLGKMRALMAIAHTENSIGQVGDETASTGPSIGPWQVSRGTASDLGLWTPDAGLSDDDARAAYEGLATTMSDYQFAFWAAKVFASKLDAAGGDLATAIERYNGSGDSAVAYQQKAIAFAQANNWPEFANA